MKPSVSSFGNELKSSLNNKPSKIQLKQKPVQQIIEERKKEKINKIIDDAVKRAIKYNKIKPVITTTSFPPSSPATSNSYKNYDPIFNPVTGKPLGLVQKNTGDFYPIGGSTFDKYYRLKNEGKKLNVINISTTTPIPYVEINNPSNIENHRKEENNSKSDVSTYQRSSRKFDDETEGSRPLIDPYIDSLTNEFYNLMHGENSAIRAPNSF